MKLIGPQIGKPLPLAITPSILLAAYIIRKKTTKQKNRASPSPSVAASGRRGRFPIGQFDNTLTVSHSAAANQVTVPVDLSGTSKKENKDDEEGDHPIR